MESGRRIVVLGGGPFGLIVSSIIAARAETVQLWLPDPRQADELDASRTGRVRNAPYRLHENVEIMHDLDVLEGDSWTVFFVTPSRQFEDIAERVFERLSADRSHRLAIMTKGLLARATRRRRGIYTYTQFLTAQAQERGIAECAVAAVSGPSLLAEIFSRQYSFFEIGCADAAAGADLKSLLAGDNIEASVTDDAAGVELGGALKNPIAIACGMAELLPGCSANFTGALLARGYGELRAFATALGARETTLAGAAGLADLIATSVSPNSRNRSFGMQFVRKLLSSPEEPGWLERIEIFMRPTAMIEKEALANRDLVEGAFILEPLLEIAEERGIAVPLYALIFDILARRKRPEALATFFVESAALSPDGELAAERHVDLGFVAGHDFKRLLEQRIYRHISSARGMQERVQRQSDTILKSLQRRLIASREKGNLREMEELPREIQLWKRLETARPDQARAGIEDLIEYYTDEIADNFSPAMRGALIRAMAPLRFIAGGMRPGAAMPYVGGQVQELQRLAKRYNILYAPTHRSHLDSVEIAFGLTWENLPSPRYAAGINLMTGPFWQKLLKTLGAYAVDRERTRNLLYLECLTRYSAMMLEAGIPSLVYPEGTRSRTGGVRPIKTGLLTTALEAYQSSGSEILIVPLALSYENTPEDEEFAGVKERSEFGDFIGKRTRCYLDICEPIRVSRFVHREEPGAALASEIDSAWRKGLRVLPNHLLARLLCENEHQLPLAGLAERIHDFIAAHPGNYLERSAARVVKQGLAVLEGRGMVLRRDGILESRTPALVEYYAAMTPEGPSF